MSAITEMATRALLLERGRVKLNGEVSDTVSAYLSTGGRQDIYEATDTSNRRPHIARVEVVTSEPNGVQRFGEPLTVKVRVAHPTAMNRGCLAFQIMNQFHSPVIHAHAYYPEVRFGSTGVQSDLECRFPNLRLNVGKFWLRFYLSEPPGSGFYETLDACSFEVIRDETVLWGWRPEVCAYHEDSEWSLSKVGRELAAL
jgi:hypothetical protein